MYLQHSRFNHNPHPFLSLSLNLSPSLSPSSLSQVMLVSQYLLLQTTPPAALVRLNKSSLNDQCDRLNQLYQSQHHGSIDDFLCHHMEHDTSRGGLLLQVSWRQLHTHLFPISNPLEIRCRNITSYQ